MAEWSIAPHSKCGIRATVSGVRIPPSPPILHEKWLVLRGFRKNKPISSHIPSLILNGWHLENENEFFFPRKFNSGDQAIQCQFRTLSAVHPIADKRGAVGLSAMCQERTLALRQTASLFDHLVGASE